MMMMHIIWKRIIVIQEIINLQLVLPDELKIDISKVQGNGQKPKLVS